MARRASYGFVVAVLASIAVAASACAPTTGPVPAPSPSATATDTAMAAAQKVAFEPVTGLPEDRATVFATELGRRAVETELNIVPRDSEEVDFRVKGYLTARSAGNETALSYVWDIFDRGGARVHRLEGEVRLPAALPDPWQAVTDDALEGVARSTAEGLSAWISTGARVTTVDAGDATGSIGGMDGTPAGTAAVATNLSIPAPPAVPQPTPSAVQAFRTEGNGPAVHLSAISGVDQEQAGALATAMQVEILRNGMTPAASAAEADVVLSAEATMGPELQNGRTVAIIWSVDRAAGGRLGTIRQIRELPAGALPAGWPSEARHAAMAATQGLMGLLRQAN